MKGYAIEYYNPYLKEWRSFNLRGSDETPDSIEDALTRAKDAASIFNSVYSTKMVSAWRIRIIDIETGNEMPWELMNNAK